MSSAEPMVRSTLPCPSLRDGFQIGERIGAAGVSRRNRRPLAKFFHQFAVNAAAQTFHVHGVNQKFRAKSGEFLQRFRVHDKLREFLPAVGDDEIIFAAFAAAQVQHQPRFADRLDEFVQPFPIHPAFVKNPAGDDDVRRAGLQPVARVPRVDAAADLQPARKRREGRARRVFVSRASMMT